MSINEISECRGIIPFQHTSLFPDCSLHRSVLWARGIDPNTDSINISVDISIGSMIVLKSNHFCHITCAGTLVQYM